MIGLLKSAVTRIAIALSIHPASRAATVASLPSMESAAPDPVSELEMDIQCGASFHQVKQDYIGDMVNWREQAAYMETARNRRFINGCLGAAQEKFDEFVQARTR